MILNLEKYKFFRRYAVILIYIFSLELLAHPAQKAHNIMEHYDNAMCVWDFNFPSEGTETSQLKDMLMTSSKKWCFQLEQGESGYEHYQGRMSLKVKTRLRGVRKWFKDHQLPAAHVSVTAVENRDNNFYVMKLEGRLAGPWTDEDPVMTRQLEEVQRLNPFQQAVIDSENVWDPRGINMVIAPPGIGKSIVCEYIEHYAIGEDVPPFEKAEDIMAWVMGYPAKKLYVFDLPKAKNKTRLAELFMAIEQIKNGRAYDKRYFAKRRRFTRPAVWVFSNHPPDRELLSADRWKLWTVVDGQLLPWVDTQELPQFPPEFAN